MTKPVHELVQELSSSSERVFTDQHRVLSFSEYLELVRNQPRQQTPTAAQYVTDCFDYFGSEDNPFIDEGMVCGNCIFWEQSGQCQIVTGRIDMQGLCKLWIIPNELLEV